MEEKRNIQSRIYAFKKGELTKAGDSKLRFSLMHKDVKVVDIVIDEATGRIINISQIYEPDHFPLGTLQDDGFKELADWWDERSIPVSRSGLRKMLDQLEINSPRILLTKCFGLSLSDQYWIKPVNHDIKWKQINFFDNEFSEDLGELLFGKDIEKEDLNFSSPDITSVGNLKKRWKIIDDKRILVKGGSNPYRQEPINEVIASKIMEFLDIPHVEYEMMISADYPYSECEDFVNSNTDFVSALQISKSQKKRNDDSLYDHFVRCAEELHIPGVRSFLDQMIVIDYIIGNEDRHLNNFGAIKDATTLEFISMAPIFDSGSSLGFDKIPEDIVKQSLYECKPFKKTHEEQLSLVTNFDFLKDKDLTQIPYIAKSILNDYKDERLNEYRINKIVESISLRVQRLMEMVKGK